MNTAQKKLQNVMQDRGVKAYSLARNAGVPESSIKNILYGKSNRPSYELVTALAKELSCSVREIFADDDPRLKQYTSRVDVNQQLAENWNEILHIEALKTVAMLCKEEDFNLSHVQASSVASKLYRYAISNGEATIDIKFARWLLRETQQFA